MEVADADISSLKNIISRKIFLKKIEDLEGRGFVVSTLEVALWSFLNTENFRDAIVSCISFGDDTDTTAAVCRGLAGLYY